ncbi:MAG: Uma2 family endonuclease [Planctomycetes bacterium]|nr:Uma2 family endonuclease [Planctomycetota bacterium]
MSERSKLELVPVASYLAGEANAATRHEYVGGVVYAMAGGSNAHNQIGSNTLVALGSRLRGHACRAFNSDTKIRLRLQFQIRFYYPDVSVICRQNPRTDAFQDEPAVIVEVASPDTWRIDSGEKLEAYTTIPSLSVYLLVEQEAARVVVYRRGDGGFVREVYAGRTASVPLPEIGCELPLAEIYDGLPD